MTLSAMADCCLFVCLRQPPHKRFVTALYQDAKTKPDTAPANAGKLVQYALSVPVVLPIIASDLASHLQAQLKRDNIK